MFTTHLNALLIDIESELKNMQLWSEERPSDTALASTQPFAVDTLSFPQWLQFIFIERMRTLIEGELGLPSQSDIAPMSEEYFRGQAQSGSRLTELLSAFDQCIKQNKP